MKILSLPLALCLFATFACEQGYEPDLDNDEEVITYLKLNMTPAGGGQEAIFSFSDPDGAGGDEPLIVTDSLQSNTTYNVMLTLRDESVDPAKDINAEVMAESTEHQVFFLFMPDSVFSYSYVDTDVSGLPLGLQTQISIADSSGPAHFRVILNHQPIKTAPGVSDGDISNADGDSDIEVEFETYLRP